MLVRNLTVCFLILRRSMYYEFLVHAVKTNSPAACAYTHKRMFTYSRYFIRDALLSLAVSDVAAVHKARPVWINTRFKSSRVSFNFEIEKVGRKNEKRREIKREKRWTSAERKIGTRIERGRERRVVHRRYVSFRYTTVLSASQTTYLLSLSSLILRLGATFFLTFIYRVSYLQPPPIASRSSGKLTSAHSCTTPEIIFFRKLKRNFCRID